MKAAPSVALLICFIMFPQIAETIYSPALPDIAAHFSVSEALAGQTLAVYFAAFAAGVVTWGILCDIWGRRPVLLAGLMIYGVSALSALWIENFQTLLVLRAISAFGAAVGSVVVQTMFRDCFRGHALSKAFARVGIALSISPVIGMLLGGIMVSWGGYLAVFATLSAMAALLWGLSLVFIPETQTQRAARPALMTLAVSMLRDPHLVRSALLVAGFNVLLFSYYLQGPFLFERLGLNSQQFGYSGGVLALGTMLGSLLNQKAIQTGFNYARLLMISAMLACMGSLGVLALQDSIAFLAPMLLVVMGFGVAIPNILSQALVSYQHCTGSAGALFGLLYYLLIGLSLALCGLVRNLGLILLFTALCMMLVTLWIQVTHTADLRASNIQNK
ncbi:multidrug effflux MFS transporter [Photobacterium sp. CCB-ST2H9]|uniref:multidrug effflux MFS transporter n=1 Tax=Photobacterium sp. CCB-ST2H9 TaxID=2912855 RepID=UPI002002A70B|nr:multidrug effflux MFS transporter [Photobacterium sp. CCB-ST2H9]UTM58201.1 multidrug effflux MFS transporter [Photobacterium sp. CCB-ST2H9]